MMKSWKIRDDEIATPRQRSNAVRKSRGEPRSVDFVDKDAFLVWRRSLLWKFILRGSIRERSSTVRFKVLRYNERRYEASAIEEKGIIKWLILWNRARMNYSRAALFPNSLLEESETLGQVQRHRQWTGQDWQTVSVLSLPPLLVRAFIFFLMKRTARRWWRARGGNIYIGTFTENKPSLCQSKKLWLKRKKKKTHARYPRETSHSLNVISSLIPPPSRINIEIIQQMSSPGDKFIARGLREDYLSLK